MLATRTDFWEKKIAGNVERDTRTIKTLRQSASRVLTVWECALRGRGQLDHDSVLSRIEQFLLGNASCWY